MMPNLNDFVMRGLGLMLWLLLGLLPVSGQEGGPPPNQKPWDRGEKGPGDRDRDRDRGPGEGGPERRGGRDRGDMFRNLSESERKQVREAFEKVWVRPEVEAARERLKEANDDYRKVMEAAMMQVDPEVVKLLEKSRPKPPPLPDVNDPEFARKVMDRLRFEGLHRGDREGRLHERVMGSPAVADLVKRLLEAPPEKRAELWGQLKEAYQRGARDVLPGPAGPKGE